MLSGMAYRDKRTSAERREYYREYYQKNKEKFRKYHSADWKKHREARQKKHDEWRAAHPDFDAEWAAKRRRSGQHSAYWHRRGRMVQALREFGITEEHFESIRLQLKNGPCDLCGSSGPRMAIDHDHVTGVFRGVICARTCNRALGILGDSIEGVERALAYLKRSELMECPKHLGTEMAPTMGEATEPCPTCGKPQEVEVKEFFCRVCGVVYTAGPDGKPVEVKPVAEPSKLGAPKLVVVSRPKAPE
jgi:hypothetical protein